MQNILIDSFENAVNEFKKAIPENIFNHFIAVLVPIRDENNILYVLSPSEMVKDEIDNNFLDKFNSLISKYSASDAKIEIVTSELSIPKSTKANINLNIASTKLNNSLTFSNYIISKFNEFPVKAVKHASKKHKCILISGYVGTGKTHLLNACG
jgi:chromosomal replication initiation ATPase DnaA